MIIAFVTYMQIDTCSNDSPSLNGDTCISIKHDHGKQRMQNAHSGKKTDIMRSHEREKIFEKHLAFPLRTI